MIKSRDEYINQSHKIGRIFSIIALILLFLVPISLFILGKEGINWKIILDGVLGVMVIYIPVGIIEFINYVPLLGAEGSYQAFITGNISNLKLPCSIHVMKMTDVKPGSEEAEVISSMAIAASSIVTTIIIAIGVIVVYFFQGPINNFLEPLKDYFIPAIFGGLGVVLLAEYWKLALVPVPIMVVVCTVLILLGKESLISIFIPIAAIISVIYAKHQYKAGKFDNKKSNVGLDADKDINN